MYKVYWEIGEDYNKELYGEAPDPKSAWKLVWNAIKDTKFKSYYTRVNYVSDDKKLVIDYGSHTRFIYLECDTDDEWLHLKEFFEKGSDN